MKHENVSTCCKTLNFISISTRIYKITSKMIRYFLGMTIYILFPLLSIFIVSKYSNIHYSTKGFFNNDEEV